MTPSLKLFNTLTRSIEPVTLNQAPLGVYSCGPTVYSFAHIGNFRSFVFADTLVRLLQYLGQDVTWVMNITDIDDKTITGAHSKGVSLSEFTQPLEDAFFDDLETLNISRADVYPRATEHFKEMRELIAVLYKKGLAYEAEDGVYFDISKFLNYGKIAGIDMKGLRPGARVSGDSYEKDDVRDFALWKYEAVANNQPKKLTVDSQQLGAAGSPEGRPGWHIECSAMSAKYLGQPFDIHTGGIDLIFPHHTNEIAQSEGAFGKPLAKFFVHNEFLLVDGKKMSKSLGNFYTLRDILKKGYDPLAFRYLCLQSHYREKMNFTLAALESAQNALEGIRGSIKRYLVEQKNLKTEKLKNNKNLREKVVAALANDLHTEQALAVLHEAANPVLWLEFDQVLGLKLADVTPEIELTKKQQELIQKRELLRSQKKYTEADKIRTQLEKEGIVLEDTDKGTRVVQ